MNAEQIAESGAAIQVENVGGIDQATVEFAPGVTVLEGRNATNRTSLLQALMAAFGSDDVSIKADADEARVELEFGGETYTRRLVRRSGVVVTEGTPYLDDPELADLFAFLLESNEARRAVARGDDLRDLIMRPVDTDAIETEIQRQIEKRDELETQLEEIEDLKAQLPELETERRTLREEIEATKTELEETESKLEAADADPEQTQREQTELEDKLDKLQATRSELDTVRYDLETERESLEQLQQEQRELRAELEALPEDANGEMEEVEMPLGRLREEKRTVEREITELQNVISFNEEMLERAEGEMFGELGTRKEGNDTGTLTDQLLVDDGLTCWTCGSEVTTDRLESTLAELRTLSQERVSKLSDLEAEIEELKQRRQELREAQQARDRVEQRLTDLQTELETTEERIERLRDKRESLKTDIASIESTIDDLEDESSSPVLDLHREANDLEYELGQLETELERVEGNISSIEAQIQREDELQAQRENVQAQIEELRTKIQRLEQDAVQQFNEHMETVLTMLEYENLERIWLERVERDGRTGRQGEAETRFELHVVRSTASGAAYEDTVEHLSESEREVTGLVFALAGYLAHELYEELPVMLLDSLEAIDAERIAALVEYLETHCEYLLVALLPEDAASLDEGYHRVTQI